MDTLTTTVSAACMIAVGMAFAEHLVNTERFGRQIRWITTLLLLIGLLRPWSNAAKTVFPDKISPQTENSYAEQLQETADELLEKSIAAQLRQNLNHQLETHGVSARVEAVDVHITEEGSIDINEVTVSGNLLTAAIYLREWLGDATKITALEQEEAS